MTLLVDIRRFNSQVVDFLPQIKGFKDFHITAIPGTGSDPLDSR